MAENSTLLLRPSFWIFFIVSVIISLYLYGLYIIADRSEFARTKKALTISRQALKKDSEDNLLRDQKISEQQTKLAQLNGIIEHNNIQIAQLTDSIHSLLNRPPEIEYKERVVFRDRPVVQYQDRIVYKDRPETFHPYGKGNGRIFIYSMCGTRGTIKVWIDGGYAGSLTSYFNSNIDCNNTSAGVSKIVPSGQHRIQTLDDANGKADFSVTVSEDRCFTSGITCRQ